MVFNNSPWNIPHSDYQTDKTNKAGEELPRRKLSPVKA